MLEGLPDNKLDECLTLWYGVSVALILRFYPERVEIKEAMELQLDQACCGNGHGSHPQMLRHACGFKLANEFWESLARSGSETP